MKFVLDKYKEFFTIKGHIKPPWSVHNTKPKFNKYDAVTKVLLFPKSTVGNTGKYERVTVKHQIQNQKKI